MPKWTPEEARDAIATEVAKLPIDVLDVRLEEPHVVVEFASAERPGCRFGFRFPSLADDDPSETLASHAWLASVNLEEQIEAADLGLPADCLPGRLTWLDR